MGKRVVLGVLGGALGGVMGAIVGLFAGYGLAELIGITSRETQAYFQVFIAFPLLALVGIVTGALAAGGKRARIIAGLGALVLFASCAAGWSWHRVGRAAEVRVRNEMATPFAHAYLGFDFRRASSLDTLEPGWVSRYYAVDLDEPGSCNGVHGKIDGSERQIALALDQQASLREGGRYTFIVRDSAGQLSLAIVED